MKTYKANTTMYSWSKESYVNKTDIIVLSNDDNARDFIQMMYGSWYDVLDVELKEIDNVHISKSYIREEALKSIKIDFY